MSHYESQNQLLTENDQMINDKRTTIDYTKGQDKSQNKQTQNQVKDISQNQQNEEEDKADVYSSTDSNRNNSEILSKPILKPKSTVKIIYPNNDKDEGCCSCSCFSGNKLKQTSSKIDIPNFSDIIFHYNKCFLKQSEETEPHHIKGIPQYDPNSSKTFDLQKEILNDTSQTLRTDEQTVYKLMLHDLAFQILMQAKKGKTSLEYEIDTKIVDIKEAYIFNKSFLSLPIQYKYNKYILCGQINSNEFNLTELQKTFNSQYEENISEILSSKVMNKDSIIRFFIAKVNHRKGSKIIK